MTTVIKTKNSTTTTTAPSSLAQGELAVNITDKKVWVGNAATTPVQLLGTGADGSFTNLAYSGTLTGGTGVVNLGSGQFYKDASGNVGIGVTPSAWNTVKALQVSSASIYGLSSTPEAGFQQNAYYQSGWKYIVTGEASQVQLNSGTTIFNRASSGSGGGSISWSESMRIDSSGNVGIGTSSPTSKLGIQGASGQNAYIECGGNGNTLGGTSALFGQNDSSIAYCWNRANAALLFGTNATERMRIDNSGNLLVGTTSSSPSSGGLAINPNGQGANTSALLIFNKAYAPTSAAQQFQYNGSVVGSISYTSSATTYSTSSDYRLKENIAPMTGALATVSALKPVTYKWKADGSDGQGFIAHELQAVVPDCVTGEKDAVDEEGNPQYQGIDVSFLVATLTCAIQELKAELDTVKSELATLKGTV
jgi:hypothetical protein